MDQHRGATNDINNVAARTAGVPLFVEEAAPARFYGQFELSGKRASMGQAADLPVRE